MKEYISKDRAKQFMCGHCNEVCSEEPCEPSDCDWMAFIDKEPAANVVEARHGRWRNNGKELESVGDGMNMFDFACRQLSELFDAPCNYNDICDYMHERDEYFCMNCDKWAVWQCWKKYFELKYDDIYGK